MNLKKCIFSYLLLTLITIGCGKKYTLSKQVSAQVCNDIKDYFLPNDENNRLVTRFVIGDKNIHGILCDCFTQSIEKGLRKKYNELQMQQMLNDKPYRLHTTKYLIVEYRDDVLSCYGRKTSKLTTEIQEKGSELIISIIAD